MLRLFLIHHDLWWNGPSWLKLPLTQWPKKEAPVATNADDGDHRLQLSSIPVDRFSSFDCYKRVIAWIMRFVHNFKAKPQGLQRLSDYAGAKKGFIQTAEDKIPEARARYVLLIQSLELSELEQKAKFSYNSRHPVILDSKHPLVKLPLHGGSLLVSSSLFRNCLLDTEPSDR